MNAGQRTHFFRLTKLAIKSYKASDPLETTRNPRSGFFVTQWDINWGISQWFLTVILIGLAVVIDVICLPFQITKAILSQDRNKQKKEAINKKRGHNKRLHRIANKSGSR
jgi:hypothetical protein